MRGKREDLVVWEDIYCISSVSNLGVTSNHQVRLEGPDRHPYMRDMSCRSLHGTSECWIEGTWSHSRHPLQGPSRHHPQSRYRPTKCHQSVNGLTKHPIYSRLLHYRRQRVVVSQDSALRPLSGSWTWYDRCQKRGNLIEVWVGLERV